MSVALRTGSTRELEALGLAVEEDDAGAAVGSNAGNLLRRSRAAVARTLLLCAHMDTVPLDRAGRAGAARRRLGERQRGASLVPTTRRRSPRCWSSRGCSPALGANGPQLGVELLFTVAEETGLNGAKQFDVGRLQSEFGYVFDHASPIGEIIVASPTYMRIDAEVRGKAAHAGLQPEQGVNAIVAAAHAITAMPQGRFDAGDDRERRHRSREAPPPTSFPTAVQVGRGGARRRTGRRSTAT